jgi:hypothetical protein
MGRVLEVKVLHNRVKDGPSETVIAVAGTIGPAADVFSWTVHGLLVPWQELLGDWNEPTSSGISLGVTHNKEPTLDFYVGLFYVTVLSDSASGVEKHKNVLNLVRHIINTAPQLIALAHCKRLLDMELPGLINIKIAGIVTGNQVVFGSILIKLLQQAADFLLGRISATGCAYIINNHIKVRKPDINELHGMEAGTMSVTVTVTNTGRFGSEFRKVPGLPKSVYFAEGCRAGAEQGGISVMVYQIGHGLIEGGKIPKCFLLSLDSFLDYIRPPPVAL